MKSAKKKIVILAAALAIMAIIPAVYFGLREPRAEPADQTTAASTRLSETTTTRQTEGTTTETSPDETGPSPDTYTYIPDVIEPVWTFSTQDTFPAWVSPMPFVNPMGREDLYTDILFEAKGDYTFEYANMQNTRVSQVIYGDAWTLHVPFDDSKTPDENKQFILDIEHYISAKNGLSWVITTRASYSS